MLRFTLFSTKHKEPVLLPNEGNVNQVFEQEIDGYDAHRCGLLAHAGHGVMLIVDVNCETGGLPFNRAWELYAHQGQLASAIQLFRGPVIMACRGSLEDNRDNVEQLFLEKIMNAKKV